MKNKHYNLCIIKPNKAVYSETFIQNHIDKLEGNISVLYGGSFPLFKNGGKLLIQSKLDLLMYLFQKKILKKQNIPVREKALLNYFKTAKINVVLAEYGMVGAMVYKVCEQAKIPLVIHFHGADAHHNPTLKKYEKAYKQAFNYASHIVCVSQFMFNALLQLGAPANKLVLNPYGVNLDNFTITKPEENKPVLFFAGRFVEKKSPLLLIKAFSEVKKTVSNAKLVMAGNGTLFKQAVSLAKQLNLEKDIAFPGIFTHKQVIAQLRISRAFVQHSVITPDGDSEGTPNSILEASAMGLPIISTFHAGITEAVINNQTGILCNENDVAQFAKNMILVLQNKNLAAQMGKAGAMHIKQNYDLKFRILALNKVIKNSLLQ